MEVRLDLVEEQLKVKKEDVKSEVKEESDEVVEEGGDLGIHHQFFHHLLEFGEEVVKEEGDVVMQSLCSSG